MSEEELSFRDRPINIDEKGSRKWVYAKKPSGKWYTRRTIFSWIVLLFLVGAPFIRINGNPFILLDVAHRKFIIFGAIFWAQDTFILALLMLSFILFIVLFTVTFGRIWCGWACPQTIFLEMVFRKIEFLIEGDYKKRYKLDNGPWTIEKILKKTTKHFIFIIIAVAMTNVFLMWFIGSEQWLKLISEPIRDNLSGFIIMMIISAVFYWIYSFSGNKYVQWFARTEECRAFYSIQNQLLLLTITNVANPAALKNNGDCIDCHQCVSVCPTGIDIRNGTQLECINCSACIDQCNKIMKVTNKPPGLIRYDSETGIREGHSSVWNARNRAYSAVLLIIFSFFIYTLISRPEIETTILRTPGLLYQENNNNTISNVYNIKIVNKTHNEMPLEIRLISQKGQIQMAGNSMVIKDQDRFESTFLLFIPKEDLKSDKTEIQFGIFSNNELIETVKTTFVGP